MKPMGVSSRTGILVEPLKSTRGNARTRANLRTRGQGALFAALDVKHPEGLGVIDDAANMPLDDNRAGSFPAVARIVAFVLFRAAFVAAPLKNQSFAAADR